MELFDIFKTSSLITREAARIIHNLILKSPQQDIVLNFEKIKSSSISFFDELNNSIYKLKKEGKGIILENLNGYLIKIQEVIKKRGDTFKIKPYSISSTEVTKVLS